MAVLSASTWNTLGLGVAGSWATLGLVAMFDPHRTAELFGVTAFRSSQAAKSESIAAFSGLIGSRDLAIGLALFILGRKRKNNAMGTLVLSTMVISAADTYLVWLRRSYSE
ncbi:hypothetical protein FZEAL_1823 [Fusarium zealandicum]|uniref:DUF4267 domain-containing protein n=1 Tax=Fusarium zealandicum TaxID=1053134 RepID=A0A8H4US29_9HYPO|nr:hypothetical protein FZEAL_1823 [Fusarium zealandicum]